MKRKGNNTRRLLRILPGLLLTATALWMGITVRNEPVQAQTTFMVTISGTGLGSGVVTDFDLTINCTITAGVSSGDCTESYPWRNYVSLRASPAPGSIFVRWLGDCSGTSPDITIGPLNRNMTCIAWFAPPITLLEERFDHGIPSTGRS